MVNAAGIARDDITLGLIAGGRATRLGGLDKAWLSRAGVPQVATVLVSANLGLDRYASAGFEVVADRVADAGPIAALEALAATCRTPWLFTLPVDVVDVNDCVLRTLAHSQGANGARAHDEDGVQPLVALWPVAALREAVDAALAAREHGIQRLQARLGMAEVRFGGVRFGNLNTPADLAAAGIVTE